MDYKLIKPVKKLDGGEIESVTIRESYNGRDIKFVMNSKGEGDAMIALVSASTELPVNTVLNMDSRDVKAIGDIARPFFSGGEA